MQPGKHGLRKGQMAVPDAMHSHQGPFLLVENDTDF